MANFSDSENFMDVDMMDEFNDVGDSLDNLFVEDDDDFFIEEEDDEEGEIDVEDLDDEEDDENLDLSDVLSDDTVGLYLKEMARVPLLCTDEEIALAKRLEAGVKAERRLKKVDKTTSTPELLEELYTVINDGQEAREHLIKANTRDRKSVV